MDSSFSFSSLNNDKVVLKGHATAALHIPSKKAILLFFNEAIQVLSEDLEKKAKFSTKIQNPTGAAELDGNIYVISENGLWCGGENMDFKCVKDGSYNGYAGFCSHKGGLYAAGMYLMKIDPSTGMVTQYGTVNSQNCGYGVKNDHYIYLINEKGVMFRLDLDGKKNFANAEEEYHHSIVSMGWASSPILGMASENDKIYLIMDGVWVYRTEDGFSKLMTAGGWKCQAATVAVNQKVYSSTPTGFWESDMSHFLFKDGKMKDSNERKIELGWVKE